MLRLPGIILLLMTCCLPVVITAQVTSQNYNSKNGLPSDEVYCVLQDHYGYIWMGTDHGLVKYNGSEFTLYTTDEGLTDNTVFSLRETSDGRLWCMTFAGGVCYLNNGKFYPHPLNDSIREILRENPLNAWQVNSRGELWFGITSKGFCKITDRNITRYYTQEETRHDTGVLVYLLYLKGEGYVYTSITSGHIAGLTDAQIDTVETVYVPSDKLSETTRNFSLLPLSRTSFLLGQWNHLNYVADGRIQTLTWPKKVQIVQARKTADGKVWLLIQNSSPYQLQIQQGRLLVVDSFTAMLSATDALVDQQHNLWFTTLENGVYLIPNPNIRVINTNAVPHAEKVISLRASPHYLYAGLTENRMLQIDTLCHKQMIRNREFASDVSDMFVTPTGAALTNADISATLKHSIFINKFSSLGGGRFLGGGGGGFVIADPHRVYFHSQNIGFIRRVTGLCRWSDSLYLIGTLNGLYQFNPTPPQQLTEHELFHHMRISECTKFNNRIFAVATKGQGLYIHAGDYGRFIREADGLPSEIIEDIYFQNDSVCWLATYKGLSKVYFIAAGDSLKTRVKVFTREDGLCSNQINQMAAFNGRLWLATNEGLCYLRLTDLQEESRTIPLYFKSIKANGADIDLSHPVLQYNQNNVAVEFHALYYKPTPRLRYKISLNSDTAWNYIYQNYVQFYNLPPGEYTFRVAADSRFHKYHSDIKTIQFTIRPHFTQTRWFTAAWVLALILVIGTVAYIILQYEKARAESTIKRLQAEFKALNYQINPHFVFNVLNSIQYFIVRKDSSKATHFLHSFSNLVRQIVANSRQPYISLIEEVNSLREYLDLEKLRLEDKFQYSINLSSDLDLEEKLIPPMIVQPLVENAIWHGIALAEKEGIITVNFALENGFVMCRIDDNGTGINQTLELRKKGNNLSMALDNVRERLKIAAELNHSEWQLLIEDKSEKSSAHQGTLVTVKFPKRKLKV